MFTSDIMVQSLFPFSFTLREANLQYVEFSLELDGSTSNLVLFVHLFPFKSEQKFKDFEFPLCIFQNCLADSTMFNLTGKWL